MAIDPSIAMGYRGLGELPNPMNQLAQVSQIQSSQRQGEMAQMQIQQMRRDETALTQFYADVAKNGGPTNPVEIEDAMIKSGVRDIVNSGLTARMTRSKLENQQKQFATIMGARMPTGAPMTAPAAAPMAAPDLAQGNALMPTPKASVPSVNALTGGGANNAAEIAFKQQQRDALIGMGTTQAIAAAKALDADIALLARPPQRNLAASPGQTIYGPAGEIVAVTPEKAPAPPAMVAEYTFAKTPAGGNFVGTFQDFVMARAKAGRAPAQPSAPTITQIVDPTDATKMITIDARRYTGGGAGSPGVIGVSGKEPTAALRENKIETGKSLLADEISNLRAALNTLNAARAIPSTERGALSNISSSLASSGVGQIAGRIVGTEAQTERDVISSSKLRLVNAIKQATGMSTQQLNSNVELQTMLKSLSDPSQSIEANIRNLDNIEKSYVNATSAAMPRASAPPTTPKAAPAPNIDALLKKYE